MEVNTQHQDVVNYLKKTGKFAETEEKFSKIKGFSFDSKTSMSYAKLLALKVDIYEPTQK